MVGFEVKSFSKETELEAYYRCHSGSCRNKLIWLVVEDQDFFFFFGIHNLNIVEHGQDDFYKW